MKILFGGIILSEMIYSTSEEKLLIQCSRLKHTKEQEEEIKQIISEGFNIDKFIALAIRHKVLQLVGGHLIRLDENSQIHHRFKRLFQFFYLGNKEKNEFMYLEFKKILKAFHENKIKVIPLKGSLLIPQVYEDYGFRVLNDLDFLISPEDKGRVTTALKKLGYCIGNYNWSNSEVVQISRKEELLWSLHAGNIHPHLKKFDNPYVRFIEIDFSYDVDLQKNYNASQGLLEKSLVQSIFNIPVSLLNPIDFLIHLCIHLYKEATNVQWVLLHADLNIIKFCDIREYILVKSESLNWEILVHRAMDLGADKALFYSFYYLDYIFGDDFFTKIKNHLNITDISFLENFGELDYGGAAKWRKSFAERFFSMNNLDEIETTSKLENLKKNYFN